MPAGNSVSITARPTANNSLAATAVVTIVAPPISVSITQLPPPLQVSASGPLIAKVTNDPANLGVDWAVSCMPAAGTTGCGSFNPTHTASGQLTTYTAPTAVPVGNTVTITATSTGEATKSAAAALSITNIVSGVSVSFVQAPPSTLTAGTPALMSAAVSNDSTNAGVDWTVSCAPATGTTDCGSFNPAHTASGASTSYTAPATVPGGGTVTLIATATADKTKTASATVIIGQPISIAITQPLPLPPSLFTSEQLAFAATVSNDATNKGVDWTVNCSDCGSFNPTHTASGATTTYTAPASVPNGGSVTITATSTADPTKSASTSSLQVAIPGPTQLLKGQYSFFITGVDNSGNYYAAAGSVTADGFGNIKAGEEDLVDALSANDQTAVPITGSYNIGADGRGTMTLSLNTVTQTLSFTLVSSQRALVIQFDGSTSVGSLDLQDSSKFSSTSISGGYSFTFSGLDITQSPAVPLAVGGVLTADGNGNFNNVTEDVNDGGKVGMNTFSSWTYTSPDSFGRGTATATTTGGTTYTYVYYVVDSGTLRFLETDANAVTSGSDFAQGSTASLAAGSYAFTLKGSAASSPSGSLVAGGLFTSDGTSKISSATLDVNNNGAVKSAVTTQGGFTLSSNGRGMITLSSSAGGLQTLAFYLSTQGVLLFELDTGLTAAGTAFVQATSISASTLSGNYALSFSAVTQNGEEDAVGQEFADGVAALAGLADVNQPGNSSTPSSTSTVLAGNFAGNANGRFTGTLNSPVAGSLTEVFYVVSSSTALLAEMDAIGATSGPATGLLQSQQGLSVPLAVYLTQPPPNSLQTSMTAQVSATVTNDPSNKGADWTVSCTPAAGTTDCGSFSPPHTASGQPSTYTAPASLPGGNGAVTITVTATANSMATASATLLISLPQVIAITLTQLPPSSLPMAGTAPVTATVANDPKNKGVDWTVTCGNPNDVNCGSFDPPHTPSGQPTTFSAPMLVPSGGGSVMITATATADSTKTTTATVQITGTNPPITVSWQQAPPTALQTTSTAQVSALVMNDPGELGVDWTVTCTPVPPSTDCGSFNPKHTANGVSTTYTAPASVPNPPTVTITATATADTSAFISQGVTIHNPGNAYLLSGQYSFYFSGIDSNGFNYAVTGSLTADGNGNITAGEEDLVDALSFLNQTAAPITGTYQIPKSDGRGTITLTNQNTGNTQTLSFTVVNNKRALIIQSDTSGTSSGSLDLQDLSQSLSGPYALALAGVDATNGPSTPPSLSIGGVLTASSGTFTTGTLDINDGGATTKGVTITSGTYTTPPDSSGRGTATISTAAATYSLVYYMVNSSTIRVLDVDSALSGAAFTYVAVGSALGQPSSPSLAAGTYAFTVAGQNSTTSAGGPPVVAGGLFTSDGASRITAGTLDVNNNGSVSSGNAITGTFTLNPDGRGTITLTTPINGLQSFAFYVSGQGVLLLELDAGLTTTGAAFAQQSTSMSKGGYAVRYQALASAGGNGEEDLTGQVTSDGSSVLSSGNADFNQYITGTGPTPQLGITFTGTFTTSASGRFSPCTLTLVFPPPPPPMPTPPPVTLNEIFYVVDSTTTLSLGVDSDAPSTGIMQLQSF